MTTKGDRILEEMGLGYRPGESKPMPSVTEEIDSFIEGNGGNARDALNIALLRLKEAEASQDDPNMDDGPESCPILTGVARLNAKGFQDQMHFEVSCMKQDCGMWRMCHQNARE